MPRPKNTDGEIWAQVKVGAPDECWLWGGRLDRDGYGRVSWNLDGKTTLWLAHRLVYARTVGPIPSGLNVCHKCDTPSCVNPQHLFLGTHADNVADRVAKGRVARGERHASAKLTDAKVAAIRAIYAEGKYTMQEIGRVIGVGTSTIHRIVSHKRWRHVP